MQTLTDAQIMTIYDKHKEDDPITFARALLEAANAQPSVEAQALRLVDGLFSAAIPEANRHFHLLRYTKQEREAFKEALRRVLVGQMRIDMQTGLGGRDMPT